MIIVKITNKRTSLNLKRNVSDDSCCVAMSKATFCTPQVATVPREREVTADI